MVQSSDSDVIHVNVAFLSYYPDAPERSVKTSTTSLSTMEDLLNHEQRKKGQKLLMGADEYKHFKWYIKTLKAELKEGGVKKALRIVHWSIDSGNQNAFLIKNVFYKAISIIIGPTKENWYAAFGPEGGESKCGIRYLRDAREIDHNAPSFSKSIPTYIRCQGDFCANNCVKCRQSGAIQCACYHLPLSAIMEHPEGD